MPPSPPIPANDLPVLGWAEWIALPELGIRALKAKVDTGAKTSSLHADDCERFVRDDADWVRFRVPTPLGHATCELPVHDRREVRSSSGHAEERPVVMVDCRWRDHRWRIELTLTDRTAMKFPMLLGRRAMDSRFLVDPGKRFLGGKPRKKASR